MCTYWNLGTKTVIIMLRASFIKCLGWFNIATAKFLRKLVRFSDYKTESHISTTQSFVSSLGEGIIQCGTFIFQLAIIPHETAGIVVLILRITVNAIVICVHTSYAFILICRLHSSVLFYVKHLRK